MSDPLDFDTPTQTHLGEKSRVLTADLRSYGAKGDEGNSAFSEGCEVVQPLGLLSRPVIAEGLEALVARVGNQDVVLAVQNKQRAAITDLQEGETRLEGAREYDARVRILPDGSIEITSITGADIRLNGGALKVARDTDAVVLSAQLTTWINAVTLATGVPPLVGTTIGNISGGAARVKA